MNSRDSLARGKDRLAFGVTEAEDVKLWQHGEPGAGNTGRAGGEPSGKESPRGLHSNAGARGKAELH